MARRCELTGTETQFGHNVSHSNRRTNRRFAPNIQNVTLQSAALGQIRMKICVRALRSVQKKGGLDAYLLATDDSKLMPEALRLKRKIKKQISR